MNKNDCKIIIKYCCVNPDNLNSKDVNCVACKGKTKYLGRDSTCSSNYKKAVKKMKHYKIKEILKEINE